MENRILIIDDDIKLIELLRDYLGGHGFYVDYRLHGNDVLDVIDQVSPNLIILDYMMPGKDGLTVLKDIRSRFERPVIMLTAKGEETDRIVGLELGADDYLGKPFNPRELLARIKAVLRRHTSFGGGRQPKDNIMIRSGSMVLNTAAHTVEVDGEVIDLSTTEFKILKVLMKNPNNVLSRDQIMTMAQGRDFMAFDRSVDIHISKLRGKIEKDPSSPKRIKTIWGTGYMFVELS
jgi:two-component system phosphate regulon response regulator OmpR